MPISAAVSIITIENSDILILKRAINSLDPWSGHLSLPGGKIDPEDSTPLDAAIRETQEECGIILTHSNAIELPHEAAGMRQNSFLKVAPFHFNLNNHPVIELQLEEHSDYYWVPIDYLMDRSKHKKAHLSISYPDTLFPYIDVQGTPLWGFTYKVLADFLNW